MSRDDESSTLTLSFNGADFRGGARNVTIEANDTGSSWITVALSGDYTNSKTVEVQQTPETYQMVFDDIPVGAVISIDANLFSLISNSHGYHAATGSKSNVVVEAGQNVVNIEMTYINNSTSAAAFSSSSLHDQFGHNDYNIYVYDTGKYKISGSSSAYRIVSEGLYEGDINSNGTLKLKEYLYQNYTRDGSGTMTWGDYTFVDYPQTVDVPYEISGYITGFTFTSANGLTYQF